MHNISEQIKNIKRGTSGVYIIQCEENCKVYIGSSSCIKTRWNKHIADLDKQIHHSIDLQNDWIKYGRDKFKFEILLECSYADSKKYEIEYIDKFNSKKFGYNMDSLNESIRKREKLIDNNILQYIIKNGYENDGNVYWFNVFDCAKSLNIRTEKLLSYFSINKLCSWNVVRQVSEDIYIGLNWDSEDGVQIIAYHKSFYELENPEMIKCF